MQERPATFSIIIPTYARRLQLAECLGSLSALEYPRDLFEVIVVDDGGETPLTEILGRFGAKLDLVLITQARAGPGAARNAGAARAKGKFLAFTDDDCRPKPDWLQRLADRFAATPGRLIGGRTLNGLNDNLYSAASQFVLDVVYSYYNTDPNGARFFASNNLALSAEGFRAVGGFDSTFRTSEDRDLCDRWLERGYRMSYAPEAIVWHAHRLTLLSFWRQHFNYGRGAFRFHQMRARRGAGRFRPDRRFYLHVLRHSLAAPRFLPSLAVWQLANAAGFLWAMANGHSPGKTIDHTDSRRKATG